MCKSLNCLVWEQVVFTEIYAFFLVVVVVGGGGVKIL